MYKIIEAHITYNENNEIKEIAVLWESNPDGWVRATYFEDNPVGGYGYLIPGKKLTKALLQEVAGYGRNLPDAKKKKYFGKRRYER